MRTMRIYISVKDFFIALFLLIILPISFGNQYSTIILYVKATLGILGFVFLNQALKTKARKQIILYILYCFAFIIPYIRDLNLTTRELIICIYPAGIFIMLRYLFEIRKESMMKLLYNISSFFSIIYLIVLLYRVFTDKPTAPIFTTNRNSMQIYFTVFIATILCNIEKGCKRKTIWNLLFLAIDFLGILLSGSTTGFLAALVGIVIYFFREKIINNKRLFLYIYILIFIAIVLLRETNFSIANYIFETFEKRNTFTNRTWMWDFSITYFLKHPIFGNTNTSDLAYMYRGVYDSSFNSHNAILAILLTSGLVGLILCIFLIKTTFHNRKRYYLVMLGMMLVTSLMESNFLASSTGFMFFLCLGLVDNEPTQ